MRRLPSCSPAPSRRTSSWSTSPSSCTAGRSSPTVPKDRSRRRPDGSARRYKTVYLQNDAFNDYGSAVSGEPQVDLAAVDLTAAERNLDHAWSQLGVEDPTETTIIISGPNTITYIVSNTFDESGSLVTDLAGEELRRVPFESPTPNS